jgi:ABC-type antimicrobial peptide transport system permease subunit
VSPVRDAFRSFAPGVPLFLVRTMEEIRYYTTWEQRFFSRTFVAFAVAALLLAALGTYGLVAYRVGRILEGILFRIPAVNVLLYSTAALLLAFTILLASYIPARRAARIDPMTALRQD